MVAELQSLLDQIIVIVDVQDKVWWSFHSSRCFSVKAFQYRFFESQMQVYQYDTSISRVWCRIRPPKTKLLLWLVLLGRVKIEESLLRLNILQNNDISCVLCNLHNEDMKHLFFTCHFARRIWSYCCQWWGVSWVWVRILA